MTVHGRKLAIGLLALAAIGLGGESAAAQGPVLEAGKTKAVYDYKAAIRERVFIPQSGIDQDANGAMDWITIDIIRPSEGSPTNKMPAIIDPSPYYTTVCRGNESQCMADWNDDGVNDRWPLFYDNYFVPRGYAYILAQMNGTGYTTNGCPMHGGPGDIAGEKSVVDWLNGRVPGYSAADVASTPKLADWHNGSSAMIGKSYDGTLSNGVASTGVEGLKTIVPVSAISAWYNYSRTGGIRHNTNYPAGLNGNVTTDSSPPTGVNLPSRQAICEPINAAISNDANVDTGDGDTHGDINTFWRDRDYVKDASKVKAAVFATHGFQDDNVRMDHEWMWWNALKANNVPRKLWLMRTGHTDPFEQRRAVWVDTLHRWFDHYLYAVNNGIENEPAVTVEDETDVWKDYTDWPIPGTQNVDVFLRGTSQATPGTLGGMTGGAADSVSYQQGGSTNETTLMNDPDTSSQANKRVFLSRPLTKDVRMSGTAVIELQASLSTAQSNLGALIVDYGVGDQNSRGGEGIRDTSTRTCWGDTSAGGPACTIGQTCEASVREIDHACYLEIEKRVSSVSQWRVTRGVLDSSNRDSLWFADATPVTIDQKYRFSIPTMATEHIFKAGHRIGVILVTNLFGTAGTPGAVVTVDTKLSKVKLPILGGYHALASAGGTDAETVAPSIGAVADITTHTADPTGVVVQYPTPTVTDNEDPSPSISCSPPSGTKFGIGSTLVTCTATDANGNTSTKSFNVVVGFDTPVGGTVPATLSLSIGAPASFGAFTPGVQKTYFASTTANVISTAGDALLSVSDPSSFATGHLVNGTFSLPEFLQARARNAANTGTAYNNMGSSASPLNLLTYSGPISNDAVSLEFSQLVKSTDALRTGTYNKALTFTLSTTQP